MSHLALYKSDHFLPDILQLCTYIYALTMITGSVFCMEIGIVITSTILKADKFLFACTLLANKVLIDGNLPDNKPSIDLCIDNLIQL